jgi:uncharacterized protein YajQ (UPF0234 family)
LTNDKGGSQNSSAGAEKGCSMASFDIVSRVDIQEVDNAVNITKKAILTRYDFRQSKTEIGLDKQNKKLHVVTEDEMKMKAIQEALIESFIKRKVDVKCLDAGEIQMASHGMIQKELAIREGVDPETARSIVKLVKNQKLKVQAAIQDQQVRVTGKNIDDLQAIIQVVKGANIEIPLQFVNLIR